MKLPIVSVIALSLATSAVAQTAAVPASRSTDAQPASTAADTLAKYYPEAALKERITGRVRAKCTVGNRGELSDCNVASEQPAGYGFGDSALKVLATYKVDPTKSAPGSKVMVPVTFDPPPPSPSAPVAGSNLSSCAVQPPSMTEPIQRYFPDRAQREHVGGLTKLQCIVRRDGSLKGCKLLEEVPTGYDFGYAAMKMVKLFCLTGAAPGGTVTFPIKFSPDQETDQKSAK